MRIGLALLAACNVSLDDPGDDDDDDGACLMLVGDWELRYTLAGSETGCPALEAEVVTSNGNLVPDDCADGSECTVEPLSASCTGSRVRTTGDEELACAYERTDDDALVGTCTWTSGTLACTYDLSGSPL